MGIKNRTHIVEALFTLIVAWITAGKPKGTVPIAGGFNEWCSVVGGILTFAGMQGFMSNYKELVEVSSQSAIEWEDFLRTWHDMFEDEPILLGDVYPQMITTATNSTVIDGLTGLGESLPSKLKIAIEKNKKQSFLISLGIALKQKEGRRFGLEEFSFERVAVERNSQTMWKVLKHKEKLIDMVAVKSKMRGVGVLP